MKRYYELEELYDSKGGYVTTTNDNEVIDVYDHYSGNARRYYHHRYMNGVLQNSPHFNLL